MTSMMIVFIINFSLTLILIVYVWYINEKAIYRRKKRRTLDEEYSRQFVRMLMSKMEIVQNDKEKQEINRTNNILSKSTEINFKVSFYLWAMFEPTRWLSHILKILVLIYGGYMVNQWNSDLSQFVWLIAVISIFENEMNRFLAFYKTFTDSFTKIERLWDVFDNTKPMKANISKTKFVYKKWDIDIKDMCFGYQPKNILFDKFDLSIK